MGKASTSGQARETCDVRTCSVGREVFSVAFCPYRSRHHHTRHASHLVAFLPSHIIPKTTQLANRERPVAAGPRDGAVPASSAPALRAHICRNLGRTVALPVRRNSGRMTDARERVSNAYLSNASLHLLRRFFAQEPPKGTSRRSLAAAPR